MSSCDITESSKAAETLAAFIDGGRLPHAILVEGADAARFVKEIAKGALCRSESNRPCGTCRDCLKAEKDIHPDMLVFKSDGGARSFHVDAVRKIRQEAYIRPNESEGKVIVLENAQNMSVQAQNALLKIIEEPPGSVTFVLTCDNKAALLETVLSRVSVFSLDTHESEGDTGIPEAEEILDQLCYGSELAALAVLARYERDRPGLAELVKSLRTSAVKRLLIKENSPRSREERRGDRRRLMKLIDALDEIEAAIRQNVGGLLLGAVICSKSK